MSIKEQFFKHFYDITDTLMLVLDAKGNIVNLNQFACQLLNIDEETALGMNWFDHFLPKNINESFKEAFLNLVAENTGFSKYFENEVKDKQGKHYMIRWHNTTLFDAQGKFQYALASGIDISELTKTKNQLQQAQLELDTKK